MSKTHKKTINCPQCGNAQEVEIYDSINTKFEPLATEQIIENQFFKFRCDVCGYETQLEYKCLYHDMPNQRLFYLVPRTDQRTMANLEELDKTFQKFQKGYVIRLVRDLNELKDKIRIFQCGLDDRVVEMVKLGFYAKFLNDHPGKVIKGVYFDKKGKDYLLYFLENDGTVRHITFDDVVYETTWGKFKKFLTNDVVRGIQIIDHDWALDLMDRSRQ